MPLTYHLVDGYNLLHGAGLSRATYGPGDLERSRTALLLLLADGFDSGDLERTTVVFDAADPPKDASKTFRFRSISVLFAVEYREADDLIEEFIRKHPAPRQLRVVSDDIRIQKAAKRRGARSVKTEVLLRQLTRRRQTQESRTRLDQPVADEAMSGDDWLGYFGLEPGPLTVLSPSETKASLETTLNAEPFDAPPANHPRRVQSPSSATIPTGTQSETLDEAALVKPAAAPEELAFWQSRIDELIRSEGDSRPAG